MPPSTDPTSRHLAVRKATQGKPSFALQRNFKKGERWKQRREFVAYISNLSSSLFITSFKSVEKIVRRLEGGEGMAKRREGLLQTNFGSHKKI